LKKGGELARISYKKTTPAPAKWAGQVSSAVASYSIELRSCGGRHLEERRGAFPHYPIKQPPRLFSAFASYSVPSLKIRRGAALISCKKATLGRDKIY